MRRKSTSINWMFVVIIWSSFIVFLLAIFLPMTGTADWSINCFAADSTGCIYVGKKTGIYVYQQGELIRNISPKTSRAYAFTIDKNDHILLSTAVTAYIMDLNGNVLESWDDSAADTYNMLSYGKRKYVSENGDTYKLAHVFGRTKIVKNNTETVYQIDLPSYLLKCIFFVVAATFCLFILWNLWNHRRTTVDDSLR